MEDKKKNSRVVVLAKTTVFSGVLRFSEAVCIQGKFSGTIDAKGELTVDKGAAVDADRIGVSSISYTARCRGIFLLRIELIYVPERKFPAILPRENCA
jgi:cytoskeletal protein CcmA (bactofilin family)